MSNEEINVIIHAVTHTHIHSHIPNNNNNDDDNGSRSVFILKVRVIFYPVVYFTVKPSRK